MSRRNRRSKPPSERRRPTSGPHVFRSKGGVSTVRITEYPDHVAVVIGGRQLGPWTSRLDRAFDRWMMPLLRPYEDAPRPVWIEHEDGSRRAFVHKLSDDRVVVATATAFE